MMSGKTLSWGLIGGSLALGLMAPLAAQQGQGAAAQGTPAGIPVQAPAAEMRPIHVYLRAGMKTHGPGQHDYPQFLADWSNVLTAKGAVVDGSYHFPKAEELDGVDVIVMYKGDSGYMTASEKAVLETFLKRGGGIVSFHDTLCSEDPEYYAQIFGGAKKHGQVNYTLEADVPYTIVDKDHPIMKGMSDFSINDEAFYLMTWAKSPEIHVLATAKIAATPSAVGAGHAGEVVPQIWTYERTMFGGQPFRSFVWMQGHTYANFTNPIVEPMILRGIAWAAHYPVDTLVNGRPQGRAGGGGRAGQGGQGQGQGQGVRGGRVGGRGAGGPQAPAAPAAGRE
jgi:type 1 glutamine amidotransferase